MAEIYRKDTKVARPTDWHVISSTLPTGHVWGKKYNSVADWQTLLAPRTNMVRTLVLTVLASCIVGTLLGFGIAYGFLTVNAWQLEPEMKFYEKITAVSTAQETAPEESIENQSETAIDELKLDESAQAPITNSNAKALIEKTLHNFGVMDVKATGSHDFFVKNVGTEVLTLTLDRTTCSCTGIDITPTRVLPGRTARCHLKYNAEQAQTGKFSQGGIIRTNDPNNLEIHLLVEGVFTNSIVLHPSSVNFSGVPAGTSRTATVRFYGFENEPLQVSSPMWTNAEHFDFQWEPAKPNDLEDDGYLSLAPSVVEGTITLKPGLPVGPFQEQLQVRTNYPSMVNVSFLVRGQIVSGNVSISGQGYNRATGIFDLGRTVIGRSISKPISIQFTGSSAPSASVQIKIVEPSWLRTDISPPQDVGSRRIFSLAVEIPDNAPTGSYGFGADSSQAHITLETNDTTMPVVKIPLQFAVGR